MIDSHCHLDVAAFDSDRAQVLVSARAAGVTGFLIPAIDRHSWKAIAELDATHADIRVAYGLHPVFLDRHHPDDIAALDEQLARYPDAAVGECGLDFFIDTLDRELQRQLFQAHLELAAKHDRPLVIHSRKSLDEVILRIRQTAPLRGVVHSFSGSGQQAEQLWALGFSVGIGGPVTHERAKRLRRLVTEMPIRHLLVETDAPDQPGASHRGERNEPAYLPDVVRCIAELRGVDPETIAEATSANAKDLFGF